MTTSSASAILASIKAAGRVTAADVLALRRLVFDDMAVSTAEIEALFTIDEAASADCLEWRQFFVEAVVDHIVHQAEPSGYVSEQNATWLTDRIARDGHVETGTELELLLKVLETARSAPERLTRMALDCVRDSVVNASGATRDGRVCVAGSIDAVEIALLRRVLHAGAGQSGLAISREEAEALFAIDRACAQGDNDSGWPDLFAKAVANHLLSASIHEAPAMADALRREKWLDQPTMGVRGILAGALGGFATPRKAFGKLNRALQNPLELAYAEENARDAATLVAASAVTPDEVNWLVDKLAEDGRLTGAERALKDFLEAEKGTLHPAISAVIAKLDQAA